MSMPETKLVRPVQVINALGLHTRPATMIVKMLQNCKSRVTFTLRKETINPKSIMSILMLAAAKNSRIIIEVEGEDANIVMNNLIAAFESGFGE